MGQCHFLYSYNTRYRTSCHYSVSLNDNTPNTGDSILVTVDTTDNVGVSEVKANDVSLVHQSGNLWNGSITAVEGIHSVNVSAADAAGNVAWDNDTSYTATTPDTELPVIPSVSLNNSTPNTGDSILVTVDTTDNVGVSEVKANDVSLVYQSGNLWSGIITAAEGTHAVNVSAVDAAVNTAWNNSTSYTAVTLMSNLLSFILSALITANLPLAIPSF